MGLAAAAALGRAGRSATVLEQFEFGHDRGSSHGTARIFKVSYPEPQFVRLAQESLVRWRELEDQTGDEILMMTGTLDMVPGWMTTIAKNQAILVSSVLGSLSWAHY